METSYVLKENVGACPYEDICGVFTSLNNACAALREETAGVERDDPDFMEDSKWLYVKNAAGIVTDAYLVPSNLKIPPNVKEGTPQYEVALQDASSTSFRIVACPTNKRGRYYHA